MSRGLGYGGTDVIDKKRTDKIRIFGFKLLSAMEHPDLDSLVKSGPTVRWTKALGDRRAPGAPAYKKCIFRCTGVAITDLHYNAACAMN